MKTFKRRHLTSLLLTSLVVSVFVLPLRAIATVDDGYAEKIREFHSDITLSTDGALLITERILYDFGDAEDRRGIYRTIPTTASIAGGTLRQDFQLISVTDDNGTPQPYTNEGGSPAFIRIGDADTNVSGQHWYVIAYTVTPTVLLYSETAELTWDAIGAEWNVPIDYATATITIPEGSNTQLQRAVCFVGSYGETYDDCTAEVDSQTTYTYTAENLSTYEGLTVRAVFDGAVAPPDSIVSMPMIESLDIIAELHADNTLSVDESTNITAAEDVTAPVERQISTVVTTAEGEEISQQLIDFTAEGATTEPATPETPWTVVQYPWSPVNHTTALAYTLVGSVTAGSSGSPKTNTDEDTDSAVNNSPDIFQWTIVPAAHEQTILSLNTLITLPEGIDSVSATCTITPWQHGQECQTIASNDSIRIIATDIRSTQSIVLNAILLPNVVTPPAEVIIDALSASYRFGAPPEIIDPAVHPRLEADITIDTIPTGYTTPRTFRLTEGWHTITLNAHKYNTAKGYADAASREGLTVIVPMQKSLWWIVMDTIVPVVTTVFGVITLFFIWYRYGRDPKGRGTIIHEYEAPKGLTPAEVGVIIDRRAHMHDISATIIDLSVRGYLTIIRDENVKKVKNPESYTLVNNHKLAQTASTQDGSSPRDHRGQERALVPHEQATLTALFPANEDKRNLSDFKYKFYTHLPGIKKGLYTAVTHQGFFPSRPDTVLHIAVGVGWFVMVGFTAMGAYMGVWVGSAWYLLWGALGVAAFITSFFMPKRTHKGVLATEHIQGYKRFLKVVEKDRLKALYSPQNFQQLFEKHLPFAIALEVEEEWAEHFQGLLTQNPRWISGVNVTDAVVFSSVLHGFTAAANSTLSSSPSSSGGSGGFSGGGFGGGGGGSW